MSDYAGPITEGDDSSWRRDMLEATLHFPTEQYGFAEVKIKVATPAEAIKAYDNALNKNLNVGLPDKEWRTFTEKVLTGEDNHIEEYEKCNQQQQFWYQETKKALNRINYKQTRE